jgi:hypothetical protein
MREALQAAGIGELSEEEIVDLSRTYNAKLERARKLANKEGFSWISLFQELDDDGSGFITYDEFLAISRKKLGLKYGSTVLESLWCFLDADNSNQILPEEISSFFRLAPTATKDGFAADNARAYLAKKKEEADRAAAPDTARVDYAMRTPDMRAKLAEAGHALPDGDRLVELSKLYNERLEDARKKQNKEGFSWYSLFNELDQDGSGYGESAPHAAALHMLRARRTLQLSTC